MPSFSFIFRSVWFPYGLAVCLLWGVAGCGKGAAATPTASITDEKNSDGKSASGEAGTVGIQAAGGPGKRAADNLHPTVVIRTSAGEIKIKLDAEKSPATVDNFLSNYVERGFYDQTIFHYVAKNSMILGGGYTANKQPKSPWAKIRNEAENGIKNRRGTIAMARLPEYVDSATSQFFINLADNTNLDHQGTKPAEYGYCVFGEVVEGMEVVDHIAQSPVTDAGEFPSTPVTPVVIESIRRID